MLQRKNAGSEYYDTSDPFIDDSELALDERQYFAQTKQQGFYVSSGEVALMKDKYVSSTLYRCCEVAHTVHISVLLVAPFRVCISFTGRVLCFLQPAVQATAIGGYMLSSKSQVALTTFHTTSYENCDRGGCYHVDPSILSALLVFTASFLQFLPFKFVQESHD